MVALYAAGLSVHLVNGIWGTLSIGLFATASVPGGGPHGLFYGGGFESLWAQFVGVVAVGVFTMALSLIAWTIIKQVWGMRVSPEDELRGLDLSEMGMEAYPATPCTTDKPPLARRRAAELLFLRV